MDTSDKNYFEAEGHDLEGRILTAEEQTRELTGQRFMDWMAEVGEDYVDQCSLPKKVVHMFLGFLMCKYPHHGQKLNAIGNQQFCDALTIRHELYDSNDDAETEQDNNGAYERFYADLAEFLNNFGKLKAQTNANLILVMEYYQPIKP